MSWKKIRDRTVTGVFLACFLAPCVLGAFHVKGMKHFTENRLLNSLPVFRGNPKEFINQLDLFLSDHFGLRPLFITGASFAKLILGVSNDQDVIVGDSGWLFARHGPFTQTDIGRFAEAFIERQRFVEAMGAHFTFLIGPSKESVYSDHEPEWMRQAGPNGLIDDLRKEIGPSNMDVIYPLEAMLAAKKDTKLYFRYDTHWTYAGAFVAAKALIDDLHQRYGQVPAFDQHDFAIHDRGLATGIYNDGEYTDAGYDLLILSGVPILKERGLDVTPIGGWTSNYRNSDSAAIYTKNDPSLPTIVVYSDSYGFALQRIIAEYFRRSVFVNVFQGPRSAENQFPTDIILAEKPDFVVFVRSELHIPAATGNPSEVRAFGQSASK
jgi:hypothetical protein